VGALLLCSVGLNPLSPENMSMRSGQLALCFLMLIGVRATAQDYQRTANGVRSTVASTRIAVDFYTPRIVRVVKAPAGKPFGKMSLSVIAEPEKVALRMVRSGNVLSLSSAAVTARINLTTGQISFYDPAETMVVAEKDSGTQFTAIDDSGTPAYRVAQTFVLGKDEAIYGLGQHQKGLMNQRNQSLQLKQNNMEIAIPFLHSANGYGLLWDNTSSTQFKDDAEGTSFTSEVGDGVDYYFIRGQNADQVIAGLDELTGNAPMFPRWAFGFWQSRERYKSQYETVGVLKEYRELGVPLDGVVQDWQYWGTDESYWNSTEFGNPGFAHPQAMVDSIHALNAHVIISVWPDFGNKTKIYQELKAGNMLLNMVTWPINPNVQVYDPFNPRARDIYWRYLSKNIFALGFDGWWMDSTEPDQLKPVPADADNRTYLGSFRKMRNAFPLATTGGVYERQRAATSDKRVFILARSAFAGQQRYGTTTWSGDVRSRWNVLRNQISGGLNLSMSGIPYWNTDIGGFFSGGSYPNGVADPAFRELYVRWMQFATFCTMMRSHGTETPREIYQFGKRGDWAFDAQEKFINLRYRLLPYIYSNAWSVTSRSEPMMRALVMDFPADRRVLDINNQYMFGKAFLVAPVTDSLYTTHASQGTQSHFDAVKQWSVYLPDGANWFDFWTGQELSGGQYIKRDAPIDLMPLYVRAGSVVPMGPFQQYTAEKSMRELEIRVYDGANGRFTLYEDENDSYNYEKGFYSTIPFSWDDSARTLTIGSRKGHFAGMDSNRVFKVVLVRENQGVGPAVPATFTKVIGYSGKPVVVKL
jgi:alpha-D-xyloside xylohydrolase